MASRIAPATNVVYDSRRDSSTGKKRAGFSICQTMIFFVFRRWNFSFWNDRPECCSTCDTFWRTNSITSSETGQSVEIRIVEQPSCSSTNQWKSKSVRMSIEFLMKTFFWKTGRDQRLRKVNREIIVRQDRPLITILIRMSNEDEHEKIHQAVRLIISEQRNTPIIHNTFLNKLFRSAQIPMRNFTATIFQGRSTNQWTHFNRFEIPSIVYFWRRQFRLRSIINRLILEIYSIVFNKITLKIFVLMCQVFNTSKPIRSTNKIWLNSADCHRVQTKSIFSFSKLFLFLSSFSQTKRKLSFGFIEISSLWNCWSARQTSFTSNRPT